MKEISVVIVNYRVKYFLEQTILSAKEALQNYSNEIIVIDNASGDDSIYYLKKKFPDVIFIESEKNEGFAKANNKGFKIVDGKYTLILNPDTIIGEKTLQDCIKWYEDHDNCGGIGIKALDGNGYFQPESKRAFPSPWVSFCKIFGLSAIFPKSELFAKYNLKYLDKNKPHAIDILCGAFMFVRTDLLRQCGGFDEAFFMYGEDIDLSYKFILSGFQNYYLPTPMIHYKGESTKKDSVRYVKVFYEAMLIFFRKHYPHYSKIYYLLIKFAIILRASITVLRNLLKIGTINKKHTVSDMTLIISKQADNIIHKLTDKSNYSVMSSMQTIPSDNRQKDIIIDNRYFKYQDIIEYIEANNSSYNKFAIYLSQADIIISPKMKLL